MIGIGFLVAIIGYAMVYSGVQTVRAGEKGPPTGILESLTPSFNADEREAAITATTPPGKDTGIKKPLLQGLFGGTIVPAAGGSSPAMAGAPLGSKGNPV